jgi:membrane-associated phospholipid phosphatase
MRFVSLCTLVLASGWLSAGSPDSGVVPADPPPETARAKEAPKAAPSDPDRFANLPCLLWDDTRHVVTAPARWDRSDWTTVGVSAAAVVSAGLLLDHAGEKFMANHASPAWDRDAKAMQNLGGAPSALIAGGMYLAGIAFKAPEVRATGVDTLVTMGLANLLLTLPLKVVVGRSRPEADKGTQDFHPGNGGQSFPSSHATQAFALASVIAEHADQPWVSCVSYGLAGLVGVARLEQRQHFLSDVVAGGLIGTFMGKAVVAYNQTLRADAHSRVALSFAPTFQPGGYGLSLALKF